MILISFFRDKIKVFKPNSQNICMMTKIRIAKALVRYKDKYLLLKKSTDLYFPENIGKWECPGGIIENETSEETVLRETQEETGLTCKLVKELPSIQMTDKEVDSKCRLYLLESESDHVELSKDHSEYQWVTPENVKHVNLVLYANLLLEFFNNSNKYLN